MFKETDIAKAKFIRVEHVPTGIMIQLPAKQSDPYFTLGQAEGILSQIINREHGEMRGDDLRYTFIESVTA